MADRSTDAEQLRALVRERYTQSIQQLGTAQSGSGQSGCCGGNCCVPYGGSTSTTGDPITSNLYSDTDLEGLPIAAVLASRGCGNPTALAELHAGEKVLDLGC